MASTDNIQINVRERPLSTDINNLQSMLGRTLLDVLQYAQSFRVIMQPTETMGTNVILGGLQATPNGSNISINAGALLQFSASLAPAPGTLDSSYRVGINRIATAVTMPAPGVETFYLIEAQMVQVTTTSENRDVLNPVTGVFGATLVPKQIERQVQFQLLTGGADAPAPSGGNWVPIAIIRRPAGGGAVVSDDIYDVRRVADFGVQKPHRPVNQRCKLATATVSPAVSTAAIDVMFDGPQGLRAAFASSLDLSAASIRSPSTVLAANQPYYLYLAPWSSLFLAPRRAAVSFQQEGVMVLSSIAPDSAGRNSANISLPAPFGITGAVTGSAYYLGTFIRDSGNTGWIGMMKEAEDVTIAESYSSALLTAFAPPITGDNAVPPVTTYVPATARVVKMRTRWLGAAVATASVSVRYQVTGASDDLTLSTVDDAMKQTEVVEVPYPGGGLDMACAGVINAGTSASAKIVGWRE